MGSCLQGMNYVAAAMLGACDNSAAVAFPLFVLLMRKLPADFYSAGSAPLRGLQVYSQSIVYYCAMVYTVLPASVRVLQVCNGRCT